MSDMPFPRPETWRLLPGLVAAARGLLVNLKVPAQIFAHEAFDGLVFRICVVWRGLQPAESGAKV